MSTKKPNLSQKIITGLLIAKLALIGVQAENLLQQGKSPIKVLIWVINQCVPILQQVSRE